MPRAVVVTNLDKERADFDETVAVCQRVFTGGGGILPLFLPLHGDDGVGRRLHRPARRAAVGLERGHGAPCAPAEAEHRP